MLRTRALPAGLLLAACLAGCTSGPERVAAPARMVPIKELAGQLGMEASRDAPSNMLVFSGRRGTIVFNPRLRGVLIGSEVCFREYATVIENERVSVPPGFIAECDRRLGGSTTGRAPELRPTRSALVVIDPGHGGSDPGAIGPSGTREKTVNLCVARLVASRLEAAGIRALLSRSEDGYIDLESRSAAGNRARADVFVSIHADSAPDPSVSGFTVFVVHPKYSDVERAGLVATEYGLEAAGVNGGRPLSAARREELVRAVIAQNTPRAQRLAAVIRAELRRVADWPDRGIQPGAYRVLKRSVCPAVLIELGFLSNPREERRLAQSDCQNDLATAIARGIVLFTEGK